MNMNINIKTLVLNLLFYLFRVEVEDHKLRNYQIFGIDLLESEAKKLNLLRHQSLLIT